MNFNFELILFYGVVFTGAIALFDILFLTRRRRRAHPEQVEMKYPLIIDYARSFFPVLLTVFLLRSFLYEPFRISSGSLEPTLLTGDFILVNKYHYGIQLPVVHYALTEGSVPMRGDIIVFRWPPDPSYDFIKRVIGLPGDKITYTNKTLSVNGVPVTQVQDGSALVDDDDGTNWMAKRNTEDLFGVKHGIYLNPNRAAVDYNNIVVPPHTYFVMGDNRDDSADSRFWGFVPDHNIVGKAELIWMSWNKSSDRVRWDRIGEIIK